MKMRYLLLLLCAGFLVACQPDKTPGVPAAPSSEPPPAPSSEPAPAPVVDLHTSRNSLDWAGTYEGLLPCADCAGLHVTLALEQDGSFEIVSRRLVRDVEPSRARGQFDWEPDGNTIALGTEDGEQRFAVGEGRLLRLDAGQTQPAWHRSEAVLPQLPEAWRRTRQDLRAILEDHRWMLIHAANASNQRLDTLFPDAQRAFAFTFAGSSLHAQGGCNGLRGQFQVDAEAMLQVTGRMSTLMACASPLMEADAALAGLMAEPLETVLVRGAQPTLALLTPAGDAIVLRGELTLEARFGAPTRIFLEVAAHTVECAGSPQDDGRCLHVRELSFDEQGLLVGEPSEWRSFTADIEGYQHEGGIRTVLRVDRFQPAGDADVADGPVYALDMVIQSEVMPQ